MKIEILGKGCPKCRQLYENTKKAVSEKGVAATVEKVEDLEKIVEYGVLTTPALAIDGEIKAAGRILTAEEIKKLL